MAMSDAFTAESPLVATIAYYIFRKYTAVSFSVGMCSAMLKWSEHSGD